jgi:hypothetical protein
MLKNLTNTLTGLKRKKPDSFYEYEEKEDIFMVDCDVRLEQGGTALVRLVRKTSVTFCCAGNPWLFPILPDRILVTFM